jgi:hypothetical protein
MHLVEPIVKIYSKHPKEIYFIFYEFYSIFYVF